MREVLRRYKGIYGLTLGHLGVDAPQGALSATLPYLIKAHHFSYTRAALLVMVSNLVGSVVQPLFGQLADRRNTCKAVILGVLMAGAGIAAIGLIDNIPGLSIAVMVLGIGVSMYHPEAALLANGIAAGERLSTSLSIFAFGGQAGFAVGPVMATLAITAFGLKGTCVFFVMAVIIAAVLAVPYRKMNLIHKGMLKEEKSGGTAAGRKDDWGMFARLSGAIFGRSIVFSSVNTFIALYWIEQMGGTEAQGALLLSLFGAANAVSVLIGGSLADRLGPIRVIRCGSVLELIALAVLALSRFKVLTALALLPLAFGISLMNSPCVVMGQEYLPNRKGFASGVTMGLAVSVGGIAAPVLGRVGDMFGLRVTMGILALIGIVPLISAFLLREPEE